VKTKPKTKDTTADVEFVKPSRSRLLLVVVCGLLVGGALLPSLLLDDAIPALALSIAIVCLILWLSDIVPVFVPTIVLWAAVPFLLGPLANQFTLKDVLGWSADPVMALFLGGFVLSVAATKYGLDSTLAGLAISLARGRRVQLIFLTALATAFLSMWMSNIAAAAMMIVALRPILKTLSHTEGMRRGMLLAIAFGANLGGIATPISSGPNAIAISAVARTHSLTFVEWMGFGVPLTLLLILFAIGLLYWRLQLKGKAISWEQSTDRIPARGKQVIGIVVVTIALWLTEPLHGASAAVVALASSAVLFLTGLLNRRDLSLIDWGTLLLIAGGLGMGKLLEQSGLLATAASAIPWNDFPHFTLVLILCLTSAFMSALMSNTATAAVLIPLAATISPEPSTLILIAIAASLGIPFVISTPPNAMVYSEGGLRSHHLLVPGSIIMIVGCVVISATGPFILGLFGIP